MTYTWYSLFLYTLVKTNSIEVYKVYILARDLAHDSSHIHYKPIVYIG